MEKGAHVLFPASRREDPDWLNPKSLTAGPADLAIDRFNERTCQTHSGRNLHRGKHISWILDVFLDSSVDLRLLRPNLSREEAMDLHDHQSSSTSPAENVEHILQVILQDNAAKLRRNFRHRTSSRLSIQLKNGQIIPSFTVVIGRSISVVPPICHDYSIW